MPRLLRLNCPYCSAQNETLFSGDLALMKHRHVVLCNHDLSAPNPTKHGCDRVYVVTIEVSIDVRTQRLEGE